MAKRTSTKPSRATSRAVAGAMPHAVAAADDAATFTTEGYITITIGDEKFELRGTVGAHLKVEYHKTFEEALPLGTIPDMVSGIAGGLGITDGPKFKQELDARIDQLGTVPGLKAVADLLKNGVVKVTDLGIDTQEGKYQFGFGVDLTGADLKYAGISLDAFGLLVTYAPPKAKA